MGKNNQNSTARRLAKGVEITLVGGGETKKRAEKQFVERLEKDPSFAVKVGLVMKQARGKFARAYPRETREAVIENAEWRRKGFESLARANELMKLNGS
jgi:type IV pilus biogenesis protein CpaD/CtpE